MTTIEKIANFTARLLLAQIFLLSGITKIGQYAGTQAYMSSAGVPGQLLPLVILLEIGGAVALIIGWQARYAAAALAGFSLLAALLFHAHFQDQMQMIMFLKNIAIAGGLLLVFARGAGAWRVDARSAELTQ
jgi:putative oxidoreductase